MWVQENHAGNSEEKKWNTESPLWQDSKFILRAEQTVYFDANCKDESIEKIERSKRTKLTAFFELNRHNNFARTLLYRKIPEHYTWDYNSKMWTLRARQPTGEEMLDMIRRIHSIHPTQIQLYALRLLLNHVRWPTRYNDIRTVHRVLCGSFQAAASHHGS